MRWPFCSQKPRITNPIETRQFVINHGLHTMELVVCVNVTLGDKYDSIITSISFIDLDTVSVIIPMVGVYTVIITDGERKHSTRVIDGVVQAYK